MAEIVVVGGGAAGMMAAIRAAERGNAVTLLEQNEKLGKKIYITGKGRCNLTNGCDTKNFFSQVMTNPRFLYSSIYMFDNFRVMDFFVRQGVRLKEERGGRVFPVTDHSSDVIRALSNRLKELGVAIRLHTKVVGINVEDERVKGLDAIFDQKAGPVSKISADAVIMAGGGRSYPSTGADGSLLAICEGLGHTVKPCRPALVPLETKEADIPQMMGLSLKNVMLTVYNKKKVCFQEFGEMLFTHFGVSGPLVLSASSRLPWKTEAKVSDKYSEKTGEAARSSHQEFQAEIDLKPALDEDKLDRRLQRIFSENANKQYKNLLGGLLPSKMIPVVIARSGIDSEKKGNAITREERAALLHLLKHFSFTITGTRGFAEAIITRGGISVKEVDPSTMESRLIQGLYFAGEMLDVDALTGGFNLQIAWSTGYLAGESV